MTTATLAEPDVTEVTEPGVYNLPEDVYHRDPVTEGSLSCSGAKRLLPPSCPALFKWEQEHGRPDKRQFDVGHAAHKLVLGVGAELVAVDAENWRTNAAKDAAKKARARGAVPLLAHELAEVESMAAALREHPLAGSLLAEGAGTPEASLFWRDVATGVMLRARTDWLPHVSPNGRLIVPDVKTAVCADPDTFARAAATYGYARQHPWYCDGVKALGIAEDVAFLFVVVEKTPPYLVSVVELDPDDVRVGRELNRRAIEVFARCMTEDRWPGYGDDEVTRVSLPRWHSYQLDEGL